jgi:hypothetical protein
VASLGQNEIFPETRISKITKRNWTRGIAHVVECLFASAKSWVQTLVPSKKNPVILGNLRIQGNFRTSQKYTKHTVFWQEYGWLQGDKVKPWAGHGYRNRLVALADSSCMNLETFSWCLWTSVVSFRSYEQYLHDEWPDIVSTQWTVVTSVTYSKIQNSVGKGYRRTQSRLREVLFEGIFTVKPTGL